MDKDGLVDRAFEFAKKAIECESGSEFILAYGYFEGACTLFEKAIKIVDKNNQELIRKQISDFHSRASLCAQNAAEGISILDYAFAFAGVAKDVENSGDFETAIPLYLHAVENFLRVKNEIGDPRTKDLISFSCKDILSTVEKLQDSVLKSINLLQPRFVSAQPQQPKVVKTFLNLRQTDSEFSINGKFGRNFSRARSFLERAAIEMKQGMLGEAEDHLLDGVEQLLHLTKICSSRDTRDILRYQSSLSLAIAEKLRNQKINNVLGKKKSVGVEGSRRRRGLVLSGNEVKRVLGGGGGGGGGMFLDALFPPDNSSLGDNLHHLVSCWKRPNEVFESPAVFKDNVTATDIHQGALGDCWLMCVFGCLATKPNLFKKLIFPQKISQNGAYAIRIFIEGEQKFILIDDSLPYSQFCVDSKQSKKNGNSTLSTTKKLPIFAVFAHSDEEDELWVGLVEKACAKLLGSYSNLHGDKLNVPGKSSRQAFIDFTGGYAETDVLTTTENKEAISSGSFFAKLLQRKNNGWLLSCGSKMKEDMAETDQVLAQKGFSAGEDISAMGIVYGHAYTILEVVEAVGQRLLKLRNPWGTIQFKGKFGPGSKIWKTELGNEIIRNLSEKARVGNVDGGTFWMDFEQFLVYFDLVHYCKVFEGEGYSEQICRGIWNSQTGGGQEYYITWRNNVQYFLNLPTQTSLFAILEQGDPRLSDFEQVPISLAMWKARFPGKSILDANNQPPIHRTQYSRAEICLEVSLPAGSYNLVPATLKPQQPQTFVLRVYARSQFSLQPILPAQDWKEVSCVSKWDAQGKDGGLGSSRNPMFILRVFEPTQVFCVLQLHKSAPNSRKYLQLWVFDNHGRETVSAVQTKADGKFAENPRFRSIYAYHAESFGEVGVLGAGLYLVVACSGESAHGTELRVSVFADKSVSLVEI